LRNIPVLFLPISGYDCADSRTGFRCRRLCRGESDSQEASFPWFMPCRVQFGPKDSMVLEKYASRDSATVKLIPAVGFMSCGWFRPACEFLGKLALKAS
jgi:hypothetical protein